MDALLAVLRVVVVTGAVVAAAAYTARFLAKRVGPGPGHGRYLAVLEALSLGQQRGMFAVRAGGRVLIVGAGRDGLSLLAEMEPGEFLAAPPAGPGGPGGPRPGEGDPLLGLLQGRLGDLRRRLAAPGSTADRRGEEARGR